jgi:hypothetical protein
MSAMLEWRNPPEAEKKWLIDGKENQKRVVHKIIAAEVGLCIFTTTSAVETLAYATLATGFFFVSPCTDKPCKFFAKCLQSSSFTFVWGLADALLFNPLCPVMLTHESSARKLAGGISTVFCRAEDKKYVENWVRELRIDRGAEFMIEEVLLDASEETLALLGQMDSATRMFVITKAIWVYVAGPKREDEIADFFHADTRRSIHNLRSELRNKTVLTQLGVWTLTPANLEKGSEDPAIQSAINQLKTIASKEESQGDKSVLTTNCLLKVLEKFRERELLPEQTGIFIEGRQDVGNLGAPVEAAAIDEPRGDVAGDDRLLVNVGHRKNPFQISFL